IDQVRAARGAVTSQLAQERERERASRRSRRRQQAHEDLGAPKKGIEPALPVKGFHVGERFRCPAPAGYAKAQPAQGRCRVASEHAEAHDADRNLVRRWLLVLAPNALALLGLVKAL